MYLEQVTCTIFVPIPAHAPVTAHQRHFQFKICCTINHSLKSSHVARGFRLRAETSIEYQKPPIDVMLIFIYSPLGR